jgi:hypothetical protein
MNEARSKGKPSNVYIFPLTGIFFVASIILFEFGMIYGIEAIPYLVVQNSVRNTQGWMLAHIFILGWVSMLAMGASFQLVQVIMNTKLYSRSIGYVHFIVYAIGLVILVRAFHNGQPQQITIGGILVSTGVVLYVLNMGLTLIKQRKWNVYAFGMAVSLINFLATVVFGVLIGISGSTGWAENQYGQLFETHLWIGVGGWISTFIVTYSLKLIPMFCISRKKVGSDGYWIIGLLQCGIGLKICTIWLQIVPLSYSAFLLIIASVTVLLYFVYRVRKKGKPPGGAIPIALILLPITALLLLLWLLENRFTIAFVYFLILGWFSATIFSYLSKIVPFLWWAYRFHTKWQKKNKIQLVDMVPNKRMSLELIIYLAGIAMVAIAFILQNPSLALIGQWAATIFSILYIFELLRILRF